MWTPLVERFDPDEFRVREDEINAGAASLSPEGVRYAFGRINSLAVQPPGGRSPHPVLTVGISSTRTSTRNTHFATAEAHNEAAFVRALRPTGDQASLGCLGTVGGRTEGIVEKKRRQAGSVFRFSTSINRKHQYQSRQ
jgi:hypothetical protein